MKAVMGLRDDFFKEETINGFLVTKKRKKIWAEEIRMLDILDAICKKYGLRYYLAFGTLLGAVRHEGFIPWDDDIDVVMFRRDYEVLRRVIRDELRDPYVFVDPFDLIKDNGSIFRDFSKIMNLHTSAIELPAFPKNFPQGLFIDIFPLDDACDSEAGGNFTNTILQMQFEIWASIPGDGIIHRWLSEVPNQTMLGEAFLRDLLKLSMRERRELFEETTRKYAGTSKYVNLKSKEFLSGLKKVPYEWFGEAVYMKYIDNLYPVPHEYDLLLKSWYGDYMTPVQGAATHSGIFYDPDVPYTDYYSDEESRFILPDSGYEL